VQQERKSVQ